MLGWALIGYGGMGHWHVKRARTMDDLFEIRGIYDIDEQKLQDAEQDGLHAYKTLDELLEDKTVDFVTIATPNDFHEPLAIQCMRAGKHVISEKPVTMTLESLYRMITASRETGKLFTVHQNRRFDEDFLIMKKIYDENTLGGVFNIESRVHGSRGIPSDWRNQYIHGGGMVLDWGIHLIDQMMQMVGQDIVSVFNTCSYVTNEEVEDGFNCVLTFASGLTARVEVGTNNFISLPRWYMQGKNGSAIIKGFDCEGEIVMVSDWEKRDAVPVVTAAGLTKTMAPRTKETITSYPLPRVESDVRDYYRNFVRAIETGETQLVTHSQMIRVIKVMEAMLESARRNEVIHERI